jgi:phosphonate degradation associated HDIG domain protein
MSREGRETIDEILRLFELRGDSEYGGEAVTQREHALQASHFARQTGASPALVSAALLHDIGHLLHDLPDDAPDQGVDDRHEQLGAAWLARWFGPNVAEPVRLHVTAKRYLCALEPGYLEHLSEPSRVSLALQGGPMSADQMAQFQASPHFADAVLLRRWDEAAKTPRMPVRGIEEYLPDLRVALSAAREMRGAT